MESPQAPAELKEPRESEKSLGRTNGLWRRGKMEAVKTLREILLLLTEPIHKPRRIKALEISSKLKREEGGGVEWEDDGSGGRGCTASSPRRNVVVGEGNILP